MRNITEGIERISAIATTAYTEGDSFPITNLNGIGIFIDNHDATDSVSVTLASTHYSLTFRCMPGCQVNEMVAPFESIDTSGDSTSYDIIVRSAS